MSTTTIFTIGHSTRDIPAFVIILQKSGVTLVADVRTIPRSRHNPQFNIDIFPADLASVGIEYVHLKELGGLKHARQDSVNRGWENPSFRGFADYMQTEDFAQGLDKLIDLSRQHVIVVMCAEAVPWRCHRSLISDALLVRGVSVQHLLSVGKSREHVLTRFAKVDGGRVWYPAAGE